MQVAANNAPIEAMHAELQKRDAEIENLKTIVEALQVRSKTKPAAEAVET